jgi:hypothetical protein
LADVTDLGAKGMAAASKGISLPEIAWKWNFRTKPEAGKLA